MKQTQILELQGLEYMERDEAASPTTMTESVMITATIDAKQNRDVMTADIPNAFVQASGYR
jgi:hypothetical protein